MDGAARQLAEAEIQSLQIFIGDKRLAQQRHQEVADNEAVKIERLEAELAQLLQAHDGA